jgi:hypothetical protein
VHDHVAVSDCRVRNCCGGDGFPPQHQGKADGSATGNASCSIRRSCDRLNRSLAIVAPSGDRSGKRERWVRTASKRAPELQRCKRGAHPPGMRSSSASFDSWELRDRARASASGRAAFDAARLGVKSVLFVTLSGEFLLDGPGPGPHGRIFHRDLVGEGHWPRARPWLSEMQVLARPKDIGRRGRPSAPAHN